MFPPSLTVIECDNPDDQFSQQSDARHLQLVPASNHLPADTVVESSHFPLLLTLLDGLIGLTVQFMFMLGAMRSRVTGQDRVERESPVPMIGRRGW